MKKALCRSETKHEKIVALSFSSKLPEHKNYVFRKATTYKQYIFLAPETEAVVLHKLFKVFLCPVHTRLQVKHNHVISFRDK